MLEKKEKVLLKKAGQEVEKAKEYTRAKNKRCNNNNPPLLFFLYIQSKELVLIFVAAAIQCLKRKRLYEQQVEQLGNFQLRIHDQVCFLFSFFISRSLLIFSSGLLCVFFIQMIMLEGAKATTETVDALRSGASAMKAMQKAT